MKILDALMGFVSRLRKRAASLTAKKELAKDDARAKEKK